MNRGPFIASIAVVLAVVTGIGVYLGLGARPSLGLDLQGGISAIYSPVLDENTGGDFEEILDQTIEVIRARVDSLGVAEPDISRQGTDVLVQLPGLGQQDVERAQEIIGQTAKLTFRPVVAVIPPGAGAELPACGSWADDASTLLTAIGDAIPEPDPTETPTDGPSETPSPSPSPGEVTTSGTGGVTPVAQPSPSPSPSPAPTSTAEPTEPPPLGTVTPPSEEPLPDDKAAVLCGPGNDPEVYVLDSAVVEFPADNAPDEAVPCPDSAEEDATRCLTLDGSRIDDAMPTLAGVGGSWEVSLDLDGPGGDAFGVVTSALACERDQGLSGQLAIVLDEIVQSAPVMNPSILCGVGITGGQASISVGGTTTDESLEEARDLSLVLRTGALPVTLVPSTFETVSPTLGAESLRTGLFAGLLGLLLVAIYLVFFYRWLGVVAIGALGIFGAVMFGTITLLGEIGFALTLAGIAGIIVSIGITADSSILFFERIRDEVTLGKTVRTAVHRAFQSAFRTNLAGNTVTLAAAIVLYFLAIGPVRGFALTLGLATILDIIILWAWTRAVVSLLGNSRLLTRATVSRIDAPIRRGAATGGDS